MGWGLGGAGAQELGVYIIKDTLYTYMKFSKNKNEIIEDSVASNI